MREPQRRKDAKAKFAAIALRLCVFAVPFLSLHGALDSAVYADTVWLRNKATAGEYAVEGRIVDYTGEWITIERSRGSTKRYRVARIARTEIDWPAEYRQGQELLADHKWAEAAEILSQAASRKQMSWSQRFKMTDLLRCRSALGQPRRAGELFLAIIRSDPSTPAWAYAPLPWYASDAVDSKTAEDWLANSQPAAQLLGAAWLLKGPRQRAASTVLRKLVENEQPQIRTLAAAQLWRLRLTSATTSEADGWAEQIRQMPANLRWGPEHFLAQVLLRQKRYDEAALTALRGPLEARMPHRDAARGLTVGARSLLASGHPGEAERLLEEVRREYGDTPQSQDAEALLARIQPQR